MGKDIDKNKILRIIEKNRYNIRKYGVKKLGLFGSFLKDRQNNKSDIDLIVVFDKPTFDKYMELKFLLEGIFSRKVDLVIEKNLKPALKYVKEEAIYAKVV